eukprot:ANDGO_04780.mRNA.1 Bifunctional dTDP-4-dehydrorhamnose 3
MSAPHGFEPSCIEGHGVSHRAIHNDVRGNVSEFFRHSRMLAGTMDTFACEQLTFSSSNRGVLRGFHCSPYWKVIVCASGSVQDVCIDIRPDSPSYKKVWSKVIRSANGDLLVVPPGVAHGFLSLENDSQIVYIQSGEYALEKDIEMSVFDPLALHLWDLAAAGLSSIEDAIISEKDRNNRKLADLEPLLSEWVLNVPRKVDVIVMGTRGYIGSVFLEHLKTSGMSVLVLNERLQKRDFIDKMLDSCKPKYVVCCAGIAGKPNIDWCSTHVPETMDSNLVCQLALAEDCRKRGIHCTLITTGALYDSRVEDKVYTETDTPNCPAHTYYQLRIFEEQLLKFSGLGDHVLALRTLYPITGDLHDKSLVTKLTRFAKIMKTTTSVTVLDELVPAAIHMMKHNITGTFNFVNPGAISYDDILNMYKEIVDPAASWVSVDPSPDQKRASCILDTTKLMTSVPGVELLVHDVETAVRLALQRMKKIKDNAAQVPS